MPAGVVRAIAFCAALMLPALAVSAQAQPLPSPSALPTENVTVTAAKSREALDKFAKAFATPTKLTGKIARWETAVCPSVVGQKPEFARFIAQRLQAIAAAAGAPVNASPSCTPNIQIIFTTTPQALLDQIRQDDPDYLGYATTSEQREKLATVTRPIQAWYTTETIDRNGVHRMDSGRKLGNGVTMSNFSAFAMPSAMATDRSPIELPYATYAHVNGTRINDATRTGLNHVIVVIDTTKMAGQRLVPLADYIAMLALTQINSLDTCQQLPSIVNILAPDCDQKIDGITATDLTYLHALYEMGADKGGLFQQDDITDAMVKDMQGH